MAKLTEAQKTALIGLLDWYFASIEVDTGATRSRKGADGIPENAARYNVEDLTGDSDAPLTAAQHAQAMQARALGHEYVAHSDASATGQVPADFVPTSAMNGRPSSGMKTDSAMVKRI
jgi:hypothetical protein